MLTTNVKTKIKAQTEKRSAIRWLSLYRSLADNGFWMLQENGYRHLDFGPEGLVAMESSETLPEGTKWYPNQVPAAEATELDEMAAKIGIRIKWHANAEECLLSEGKKWISEYMELRSKPSKQKPSQTAGQCRQITSRVVEIPL